MNVLIQPSLKRKVLVGVCLTGSAVVVFFLYKTMRSRFHALTSPPPCSPTPSHTNILPVLEKKGGHRDILLDLLQYNSDNFHVEFKGYLSNHLPMALISLRVLGASDSRLEEYTRFYKQRLEPKVHSSVKIDASTWSLYIGQKKHYEQYVKFFTSELHRLGTSEDLINTYLPFLMEGICGAAFHANILLGFGVESGVVHVQVEGLAYLAFAFLSLGNTAFDTSPKGASSRLPLSPPGSPIMGLRMATSQTQTGPYERAILRNILEEIHKDYHEARRFDLLNLPMIDSFQKRMARIALNPALLDKYDIPLKDTEFIDTEPIQVCTHISSLLAELYSGCGNFFVLHGVTGTHATSEILGVLNSQADQCAMLRYLWRAICATYISEGAPSLPSAMQGSKPLPEWSTLIPKAINDQDEHVIKLVFACFRQYKLSPDASFLRAAQRIVNIKSEF